MGVEELLHFVYRSIKYSLLLAHSTWTCRNYHSLIYSCAMCLVKSKCSSHIKTALAFFQNFNIINNIYKIRQHKSTDKDMIYFLRFSEREALGCELPNTGK